MKDKTLNLICPYLKDCGGCHYDNLPYETQSELKLQHLELCFKEAGLNLPRVQFISLGQNHLRNRFDFTIEANRKGLYGRDKSILDIQACLQITPELQAAYDDFRKIDFGIKKGSVRLRVGPDKNRGVWLDFANIDIKTLLDDGKSFQQLLDLGFQIEIGQKGKSLVKKQGLFKLADPVSSQWFQVHLNNYVSFNLSSLISSFTQPSWTTANSLVEVVHGWVDSLSLDSNALSVCEFGAGIGQFTLPLLSYGHHVDVFEFDQLATEMLAVNAKKSQLQDHLTIYCDDFQKKPIAQIPKYDLALLNPPRSGLKNFVHEVTRLKTKTCIYISCFPESLAQDLKAFVNAGYEIKDVVLVDQFPQTKHFETCVLLQRIDTNT